MHFSAKRGLAIACSVRPSVRLSVALVDCDHIDWKSWKLAQAISPSSSLFAAKRRSTDGGSECFQSSHTHGFANLFTCCPTLIKPTLVISDFRYDTANHTYYVRGRNLTNKSFSRDCITN